MKADNYFIQGVLVGSLIFMGLTYIFPYNIRPTNDKLIEHGMAYHDANTGEVIWRKLK